MLVIYVARIVDKRLRLAGNGLYYLGMSMAGIINGRACQKVDINLPIYVRNGSSRPLLNYQGEIVNARCRGDQGLILSHYLSVSRHPAS